MINNKYIYGFLIITLLVVLHRMKNLGIISNREWNLIFLFGWLYLIYDIINNKLYKGKMKIFMIVISILFLTSYLYKIITNKNSIFSNETEKDGFDNFSKVNFNTNKKEKLKAPAIQPHDGVRINFFVSKIESLLL